MVSSYSRKLQNNLDDLELHEPARGSSEKKMLSEKSMGRRHYAKLKTKPVHMHTHRTKFRLVVTLEGEKKTG